MNDAQICRLMLFALLAIGLGLIVVAAIVPTFVHTQANAWLSAEEQSVVNARESAERVLRRVDREIQFGLFALGGLVTMFSMIGLWSFQRAADSFVSAGREESQAAQNRMRRLPRLLGFGLMFLGLVLSLMGRSVEVNSIRSTPATFGGGLLLFEDRSHEREQAHALKNAGLGLVVAGPIVWCLAGWLLARRSRDEPVVASAGRPEP